MDVFLLRIIPTMVRLLRTTSPLACTEVPPLHDRAPLSLLREQFQRGGGFSDLLQRTRGLSTWLTLLHFILADCHLFLILVLGLLGVAAAGLLLPYFIESLLSALASGNAGAAWACVGRLCGAVAGTALCFGAAYHTFALLELRSWAVLVALGAAKGLLQATRTAGGSGRGVGEQQLVLSDYAQALRGKFSAVAGNTWLPLLQLGVSCFSTARLLGVAAGLSAAGAVFLLTLLAFRVRAATAALAKATKTNTARRLSLLEQVRSQAVELCASGWLQWAGSLVQGEREAELKALQGAAALRIYVDAMFTLVYPVGLLTAFSVYAATHEGSAPPPAVAFSAMVWLSGLVAPCNALAFAFQPLTDLVVNMGKLRDFLALPLAPLGHMQAWRESGGSDSLSAVSSALTSALATGSEGRGGGGASEAPVPPSPLVAVPPPAAPPAVPLPLLHLVGASVVASSSSSSSSSSGGGAPPSPPLVTHLNLTLHGGELVVLCGSKNTGKSTLLGALVGDGCALEGDRIAVNARVAYLPSRPWLQRGSLRENVCGLLEHWGGGGGPSGAAALRGAAAVVPHRAARLRPRGCRGCGGGCKGGW